MKERNDPGIEELCLGDFRGAHPCVCAVNRLHEDRLKELPIGKVSLQQTHVWNARSRRNAESALDPCNHGNKVGML